MDREQRERLVDGALARALAPKNIEPRAGFEERLLANLAAQPERRPAWRWVWVPALAAAAVLALVLGVRMMRRPAPPIEANRKVAQPAQQSPEVAEGPHEIVRPAVAVKKHAAPGVRVRPRIQIARVEQTLPKQDVFPTPAPITDQERLLLALVHRRPRQAQDIAAEQEVERQQIQKYLESGFPSGEPGTAQQMR